MAEQQETNEEEEQMLLDGTSDGEEESLDEDTLYNEDEQNSDGEEEVIPFDSNLPMNHSYLAFDRQNKELSHSSKFDYSEDLIHIPLWTLNTVVFPFDVFPLRGSSREIKFLVLMGLVPSIEAQSKIDTFGLINDSVLRRQFNSNAVNSTRQEQEQQNYTACIGVTVDIQKCLIEAPNGQMGTTFSLLLKVNRRFRVFNTYYKDDILWGKVLMLEEGPTSLNIPLVNHNFNSCTIFPKWIKEFYCPRLLLNEIKLIGHGVLKANSIPDDPIEASYWVARNLVLNNETRQKLLEMTLSERLREEIQLLQSYNIICCVNCGLRIADTSSIFSMSKSGPQSAFVNRLGFVHDTITLRTLQCNQPPLLFGQPSTQDTWFEGYAWIIFLCPGCTSHLGWKYVRTQNHLSPSFFWGLSRPKITRATTDEH